MATQIPLLQLRDWSAGAATSLGDTLMPDNALRLLINAQTDESYGNLMGNIMSTPGYAHLGDVFADGKKILGLTNFVAADNSFSWLVRAVNLDDDTFVKLEYYDTNTLKWIEIGTNPIRLTANKKVRFATFLGYLFFSNGIDAPKSWDGTVSTDWGTTHLTGAPIGSIIFNAFDKLHIFTGTTDFYSTIPSGGIITWNTATQFIQFNPDDNDQISAVALTGGIISVMKQRAKYSWNGQSTQSDRVIDIGCTSQETVETIQGITYFHGTTYTTSGIYEDRGEFPVNISRPIQQVLDAVPQSQYKDMASWKDDDHYHLFLGGDVTIYGLTFQNLVASYSVSKGSWSFKSIAHKPTVSCEYVTVSDNEQTGYYIVFGDQTTKVHQWMLGNDFDGENIYVLVRTKKINLIGTEANNKTIHRLLFYSEEPQGAIVRARIDSKEWNTIATLKKPIKVINSLELQGRFIEFEIALTVTEQRFSFEGIDIVYATSERAPR